MGKLRISRQQNSHLEDNYMLHEKSEMTKKVLLIAYINPLFKIKALFIRQRRYIDACDKEARWKLN